MPTKLDHDVAYLNQLAGACPISRRSLRLTVGVKGQRKLTISGTRADVAMPLSAMARLAKVPAISFS